jgi:hypothetical protein
MLLVLQPPQAAQAAVALHDKAEIKGRRLHCTAMVNAEAVLNSTSSSSSSSSSTAAAAAGSAAATSTGDTPAAAGSAKAAKQQQQQQQHSAAACTVFITNMAPATTEEVS